MVHVSRDLYRKQEQKHYWSQLNQIRFYSDSQTQNRVRVCLVTWPVFHVSCHMTMFIQGNLCCIFDLQSAGPHLTSILYKIKHFIGLCNNHFSGMISISLKQPDSSVKHIIYSAAELKKHGLARKSLLNINLWTFWVSCQDLGKIWALIV